MEQLETPLKQYIEETIAGCKVFKCSHCNKIFQSDVLVNNHILNKHSVMNYYYCIYETCQSACQLRGQMLAHYRTVHGLQTGSFSKSVGLRTVDKDNKVSEMIRFPPSFFQNKSPSLTKTYQHGFNYELLTYKWYQLNEISKERGISMEQAAWDLLYPQAPDENPFRDTPKQVQQQNNGELNTTQKPYSVIKDEDTKLLIQQTKQEVDQVPQYYQILQCQFCNQTRYTVLEIKIHENMDHGKGFSFYCPVEGCEAIFRLRFQQMAHLRRKHNVDTGVLFFAQRNNIGVFPFDQKDPTVKTQLPVDQYPGLNGLPATTHAVRSRATLRDKHRRNRPLFKQDVKFETKREALKDDRVESEFDQEPKPEDDFSSRVKCENQGIKFEVGRNKVPNNWHQLEIDMLYEHAERSLQRSYEGPYAEADLTDSIMRHLIQNFKI